MKRLKIISFYNNEKVLIRKAIAGHPNAQQAIYEKFAPKMLGVCRQYIKDLHYAEDVMINGFVKVFKSLNSFRHEALKVGSGKSWLEKLSLISGKNNLWSLMMRFMSIIFQTKLPSLLQWILNIFSG